MELKSSQRRCVQESPLFRGVAPEELDELLCRDAARCQSYRKGEVIFAPHEFARSLGIVLSGSVSVSKGDFPVSSLQPGDLFGAAALYNDEPDYATTLRVRRDCTVLLLSEETVDELLSNCAQARRNYIRYLSERIRFLNRKMGLLSQTAAEDRLMSYLQQQEKDGQVCLDCSLSELAKRLGMGRASLYRAFDILETRGRITRSGKGIALVRQKG